MEGKLSPYLVKHLGTGIFGIGVWVKVEKAFVNAENLPAGVLEESVVGDEGGVCHFAAREERGGIPSTRARRV